MDLYNKLEKNKDNTLFYMMAICQWIQQHYKKLLCFKIWLVFTPFIPGWDTHGLPIENEVIKKGIKRKNTLF